MLLLLDDAIAALEEEDVGKDVCAKDDPLGDAGAAVNLVSENENEKEDRN